MFTYAPLPPPGEHLAQRNTAHNRGTEGIFVIVGEHGLYYESINYIIQAVCDKVGVVPENNYFYPKYLRLMKYEQPKIQVYSFNDVHQGRRELDFTELASPNSLSD